MVEEVLVIKTEEPSVSSSSVIFQLCGLEHISHLWKCHLHLLEQAPWSWHSCLGRTFLVWEAATSFVASSLGYLTLEGLA